MCLPSSRLQILCSSLPHEKGTGGRGDPSRCQLSPPATCRQLSWEQVAQVLGTGQHSTVHWPQVQVAASAVAGRESHNPSDWPRAGRLGDRHLLQQPH